LKNELFVSENDSGGVEIVERRKSYQIEADEYNLQY
jgi:hypothetical protein